MQLPRLSEGCSSPSRGYEVLFVMFARRSWHQRHAIEVRVGASMLLEDYLFTGKRLDLGTPTSTSLHSSVTDSRTPLKVWVCHRYPWFGEYHWCAPHSLGATRRALRPLCIEPRGPSSIHVLRGFIRPRTENGRHTVYLAAIILLTEPSGS